MYSVIGNAESQNITDLRSADLQYEYPDGLDLKPGSRLHESLKKHVMSCARVGHNHMQKRYSSWREVDRVTSAYVELDETEKEIKKADARRPVSIVFPYSYVVQETVLSYLVSAFLQDPVFTYEGAKAEDEIGAILMTHKVQMDCRKYKAGLAFHTMFRDGFSYGIGIVAPQWDRHSGFRVLRGTGADGRPQKQMQKAVLYEGNSLCNIDPYKFLPDPSVSIHNVQKGEFVGWLDETNYNSLLGDEIRGAGLFNVKYLKMLKGRRSCLSISDQSDRNRRTGMTIQRDNPYENTTHPIDVIYMYCTIIPKEFGLGDQEDPEKWLFALAADEVLIKAQPLNLAHNMYPVAVCAPDFDGYSATPVSRLEILYGLQGTLDWLFNSHIANVRKAVNDMILYDPYSVNGKDLEDPSPGKLIRLRRPAWGKGVKDVAMQFQINDITRANIADSSFVVNWMQKIGAADDSMMGSLRSGGPDRLSAAEFQGTMRGSMSRLQRVAQVVGMQAMQDVGYMFAHHTQQLMSEEVYITAVGQYQRRLEAEYGGNKIKVTPFDLLIDFDLIVRDGSTPGGSDLNFWSNIFATIAKTPELAQILDVPRIFTHMARESGAKNVDDFIRTRTATDESVIQQAQAGNMIPVQQAFGGMNG